MKNSKKRYSYNVVIMFCDKNENANIGDKYTEYKGGGSFKDTITFSEDKISMELSRAKKYEDGLILSNANNTINAQIIKALLCYYAISPRFPLIKDLSIYRKDYSGTIYEYNECKSFIQPLGNWQNSYCRPLVFSQSVMDVLLNESPKGQSFRIAMSYWLKGYISNDEYFKFDHYWRAFNRLYMYLGCNSNELNSRIAMRDFILRHERFFSKSISVTNMYSQPELHSYRWNKMILNDYNTRSKTEALKDFVLRHHDCRIMQLLKEKLACRMQFLKDKGLDGIVNLHIKTHNTSIQDGELVTLISIKYAYYIRNRFFHGEVPDGTFKIKNDNIDQEIQRINNLLEVLVWELIENHSLFV